MLDITFIWAIDFRVIDFNAEWQQYERVMVGLVIYYSHIYVKPSSKMQTKDPLSSSPTFLIILLSFGFPSFYYAVVSCHLERRWCWRPENIERSNLARRSLHLHGSDCCGQWHCLLWSQDCRSVSAWGEHRCKESSIVLESYEGKFSVPAHISKWWQSCNIFMDPMRKSHIKVCYVSCCSLPSVAADLQATWEPTPSSIFFHASK